MQRSTRTTLAATALLLLSAMASRGEEAARMMPAPATDVASTDSTPQTAIFAGGCFWGVQAVFQHVQGVSQAVSGYTGGHTPAPTYDEVSEGTTGHAESVRVTFDPTVIRYASLLRIFFSVALDPTEVDRQGPDSGTQYRSVLFVLDPEQDRVAHAYLAQLDAAHVFARPIATRIDPAQAFTPAETYHQDYLQRHPDSRYIVINDQPKVRSLQQLFPASWRDVPSTVRTASATP